MKYQVSVEQGEPFELLAESIDKLDVIKQADGSFHLLQNGKAYTATLIAMNLAEKKMTLRINHNDYDIQIKDEMDILVEKMGFANAASKRIKDVKAPMPGLVIDIMVKEGQVIQKGDALLVLEAMKMENVIKADGDGEVKKISIQKGNTVDKGQTMIEMV